MGSNWSLTSCQPLEGHLTSSETIRLIRDGEGGEGVWRWGEKEITVERGRGKEKRKDPPPTHTHTHTHTHTKGGKEKNYPSTHT